MPRPKGYEVKWNQKDKKWKVRLSGSSRASRVFDNKKDALYKAKEFAKDKNTLVRVYTRDGRHQETLNYTSVERSTCRS